MSQWSLDIDPVTYFGEPRDVIPLVHERNTGMVLLHTLVHCDTGFYRTTDLVTLALEWTRTLAIEAGLIARPVSGGWNIWNGCFRSVEPRLAERFGERVWE